MKKKSNMILDRIITSRELQTTTYLCSSALAYLKENFPLKVAFGGGLFHLGWSKWHLGTRPSWGQWSRWGTSPRSWSDGNPRALQDLRPKREKKIEK